MHIFQCDNKQMKEIITNTIKDSKQKLEKANVPREVYRNFFNQYRRSCNIDRVQYDIPCEAAEDAVENQETLGNNAILNSFLIHQWTYAIESLWKQKEYHPSMERSPKQRSPYQMGVLLNESVWDISEKVWTQRNEMLHKTTSPYVSKPKCTIFLPNSISPHTNNGQCAYKPSVHTTMFQSPVE